MHVWIVNECISSHELQQSYFSIMLTAAIDLKVIWAVRVPPRTGPINSLNRMEKKFVNKCTIAGLPYG